jgi:Na+/proline symporter
VCPQIIIYFVVRVLGFLLGLSGLYLATVLSGSLSTLSSGLNALAANTVEDILWKPLAKLSPANVTRVTKVVGETLTLTLTLTLTNPNLP